MVKEVVVTDANIQRAIGDHYRRLSVSVIEVSRDQAAVKRLLTDPGFVALQGQKAKVHDMDVSGASYGPAVKEIIASEGEILDRTGTSSHQEQIAADAYRRSL